MNSVRREQPPEDLAEVVEIAMVKHTAQSGRDLARKSRELKTPLSYTVINELRRNTYLHPLGSEQRAFLSKLSGVPLGVIDELAGARSLAPFKLPDRAGELSGDQRKAVLSVVSAFINANEELETVQSELDAIDMREHT
jgi:hypothetical protein